jgi:hypothetical protein
MVAIQVEPACPELRARPPLSPAEVLITAIGGCGEGDDRLVGVGSLLVAAGERPHPTVDVIIDGPANAECFKNGRILLAKSRAGGS